MRVTTKEVLQWNNDKKIYESISLESYEYNGEVDKCDKYDSNWWFGKNSLWAQSGAKEKFTGGSSDSEGIDFGDFTIPTTVDISDDLKLALIIFGGLFAYKLLSK